MLYFLIFLLILGGLMIRMGIYQAMPNAIFFGAFIILTAFIFVLQMINNRNKRKEEKDE